MTKCKQCGLDVPQTKGKQAKVFCDDSCRKAFSRATSDKKEQPTSDISTSDTHKSNLGQDKSDNLGQTPYYSERNKKQTTFKQVEWSGETEPNDPRLYLCKGCQKPVLKNVEICSECVGKKITRKSLNLPEVERLNYTDDKFIPNYSKTKDGNGKKKEVLTYKGAIEKAIYSIASIGCDCIIGNKIYEASKVMKTADKFKA